MTTFTSDDREEEYKKILAEAPNQPGYEDAVPIPFAGWVNMSPPHIVDSGASVMDELTEAGHIIGVLREQICQQQAEISLLQEYVCQLEEGLDSSINLNKAQAERNNEPVAYVNSMCNDYIDWKVEPMSIDGKSLYTHPVKELTDEEIDAIGDEVSSLIDTYAGRREFARAILRKAQKR